MISKTNLKNIYEDKVNGVISDEDAYKDQKKSMEFIDKIYIRKFNIKLKVEIYFFNSKYIVKKSFENQVIKLEGELFNKMVIAKFTTTTQHKATKI